MDSFQDKANMPILNYFDVFLLHCIFLVQPTSSTNRSIGLTSNFFIPYDILEIFVIILYLICFSIQNLKKRTKQKIDHF